MKLIVMFNLVLLMVFLLGMAATAYVSHELLHANARSEIRENARILMDSALAVRKYTSEQIKPLLETQMKYEFLPQSVPSYSATEYFSEIHRKFPEYSDNEAALNPTNPRDRAADWAADIVHAFRSDEGKTEVFGERDTPNGRTLLPCPAAEDQGPGLPAVSQHGRDRTEDHARQVRHGKRLRLEPAARRCRACRRGP